MQTQSILNIRPNVNFQSKDKLERASKFVNMNDSQLQLLAYNASVDKDKETKDKKNIFKTFCAIPIVDTLASGILVNKSNFLPENGIKACRNASLSLRTFATARTAANWVFGLGLVSLYSAAKNKVLENNPNLNKYEKQHPIESFFTDIGIIMGTFALGYVGIGKLVEKSIEKNPKAADKFDKKIVNIFEKLDKTHFNQRTLPRIAKDVEKLEKNAPFVTKLGRFALANSVWILLGAALYKMAKHADEERNKVEQNYQTLKAAQLQTAKHLVNTLSIERDVLAQDQPELADDLRRTMNGKNPVSRKEMNEIHKKSEIYEDEKLRMQIRENEEAKNAEQEEQIEEQVDSTEQTEQTNESDKPAVTEIIYITRIEDKDVEPEETPEG